MGNAPDTKATSPSANSAQLWGLRLGAWLIGAMFLLAAIAKLMSLESFQHYVYSVGLAGSKLAAAWLARLLIGAELFLGLGFFQRAGLKRFFVPVTIVVLAGFSVYLAYIGFIRGDEGNCHCLGDLLPMSPLASLAKNLVLLVVALFLWFGLKGRPCGRPLVPVALGVLSFAVVLIGFPVRPTPELSAAYDTDAPPSRFARFQDFGLSQPVDLTEGTRLVIFVSFVCDHCQVVTRHLSESSASLPPAYLVAIKGEEAEWMEFSAITQTTFPYLLTDIATFLDFIGQQPPRIWLLHQGQVVAYWDDADFSVDKIRQASQRLP